MFLFPKCKPYRSAIWFHLAGPLTATSTGRSMQSYKTCPPLGPHGPVHVPGITGAHIPPPPIRTHRGHRDPARGAALLQPPREVRACPGGFYGWARRAPAGPPDRSLPAGTPRTRPVPGKHPTASGGRSGGAALLTAGAGTVPASGGARNGARNGARPGARPYRGTGGKAAPRGGSARARQQRALRRARARRSGEAPRCSMAATCGGKSAAVTLRPGPPAPAGPAPGHRDFASVPLPTPDPVPKDAAGQQGRDGGGAARGQGELAFPKAIPGPVRGAAVPAAQRLKR